MQKLLRKRPSAAMIVAMLALSASLVGTAVAAGVFTKQERKAVKKIANKQIKKLAPSVAGPAGKNGATNVVVRSAGFTTSGSVSCNSGETATGGGVEGLDSVDAIVLTSRPQPASGTPTGWFAQLRAAGEPGTVYVLCASP